MRVPARASAAARFPSPPDPPEGGPAVSRHTRLTPIHASTVVSHHILPSVWAGSPNLKCLPGTGLPPEAAPCSRRRDSRRAGDPFRSMARRAPGGPPVGLGCDASMRARLPWRGGARRCKACMRGLQHGSAAGLGANRPERAPVHHGSAAGSAGHLPPRPRGAPLPHLRPLALRR